MLTDYQTSCLKLYPSTDHFLFFPLITLDPYFYALNDPTNLPPPSKQPLPLNLIGFRYHSFSIIIDQVVKFPDTVIYNRNLNDKGDSSHSYCSNPKF